MEIRRLDIILNFPTSDVRRNFRGFERIDRFVGSDEWRDAISSPHEAPKLVEILRSELGQLGYRGDQVRSVPIKDRGRLLYHLMFASKDPLGEKIWQSVTSRLPDGQSLMF